MSTEQASFLVFAGQQGLAVVSEHDCFRNQSEIPQEYQKLYSDYVAALKDKCEYIMWVVLDRGHKIMQVEKEKHKSMIEQLLRSGDAQRVKVAEEVMKRSMGTWEVR